MKKFLKSVKNRTIALMMIVLIAASVLPAVWSNSISADSVQCGLIEHTHSQEGCYELQCTYVLSDSDYVHSEGCDSYVLICGETEHVHSWECHLVSETDAVSETEKRPEFMMFSAAPAPAPNAVTNLSVGGLWDVDSVTANGSVSFDSAETASIDHDSNLASETVKVRISAAFPEGSTEKQLKITLAEGLEWFTNGAETIPSGSLESVSNKVGESNPYGLVKLGNGSYTYKFSDGVKYVDVDIMVKKSYKTNFPSIADAIKAEVSCNEDGIVQTASSSLTKLEPEQISHASVSYQNRTKNVKPDEVVYDYTPLVMYTYTGSGFSNYRLYDYAEVTVKAPSDVEFVSAATGRNGNTISTNSVSGWELISSSTENGITTYNFRVEKKYTVAIGITMDWIIPSSAYEGGDVVKITATELKWKIYGDDEVYSYSKPGVLTFNVVDPNKKDEIVTTSAYNHTVNFDPNSPDAVYQLTGWYIENTGSDPSAPKVVEFEFDYANIGVTDVCLLIPRNQTVKTVWYKLKSDVENGDDTWRSATVNKKVTGSNNNTLVNSLVSNLDLGLSENDYLAAFKYELDFLSDNGTASDTSDDYRYGIPAVTKASGNSGYHPIAGVNLNLSASNPKSVSTVRVYDKVEDGQEIINDTGKKNITANYSESLQNHVQVDSKQDDGKTVVSAGAGDTFSVKYTLTANRPGSTSLAYCVGFTHYPIIYIRDETGEGITNVKLKNINGVDILSAYSDYVTFTLSHTETEDYNGDGKLAKVYKIDTTGLRNAESKTDRYAAAIGFFSSDTKLRTLTLTYNVTTPSTYGDSQTKHYFANAIMFSDLGAPIRKSSNGRAVLKDPFDVDQNGSVSSKLIYQPLDTYTVGYYEILSRNDISISLSAKKQTDSAYTSWDGSANYIQFEPDAVYNIKAGVFNGAGVTTSTHPDGLTYVYIPIPKEGEDWGAASRGIDENGNPTSAFAYTTSLAGAVTNPNPSVFTVDYGYVNTSAFGSSSLANIGSAIKNSATAWSSNYSGANCIRITICGMPASTVADDFIIPIIADADTVEDNEVNILSAIYYEDMTNNHNQNFTGWFSSDEMAIQVAWGEISGIVWEDLNGNGIRENGEAPMSGVNVSITASQSAAVYLDDGDELTAVTGADGRYSFGRLPAGTYTVSFEYDEDEYSVSPKNAGGNDRVDNDAEAAGNSIAEASGVKVPGTDDVGNITYAIENTDLGLAPNIEVSYEWDGDIPESASKPVNETIATGTAYTASAIADIYGYTFDGWYTDEALANRYTNGTKLIEDTVLYGKWTINSYDVIYNWTDAPAGAVKPSADSVDYKTAYNSKQPDSVTGYTFDGWYTDEACTAKYADGTEITEDTELYGKWTVNQYTVTWNVDGTETTETINYGAGITKPADPAKTGYTFAGWDKEVPDTMPAENLNFKATWTINSYDVVYNWTDAPAGAVKPSADSVDYKTAYNSKQPDSVTGYTFDGWYTDEACTAKFADGTEITEDTELYGKWTVNQYTVTWNVDGTETTETINYCAGITKPADPAKTGYTFAGWDKEVPDTMPAENLIFKATWTINSYDVVYNWTDAPAGAVKPSADTVNYKTAYSSKQPDSVTGYTFDGWYTDEVCTVKFADGTEITEDTELYGRWTRNTVQVSGSKIWAENGEGFERPDSVTVELYRNETLLDSVTILKDDSALSQSFSFDNLYEYDEEGNRYTYTVREASVPENYISVVTGYDITNTYNVDRFVITKEWDHSGNPGEKPESVEVKLWCDDAVYKTVTLSESNSFSQTVTVPRLEAEGHTFRIEEITVDGYITEYVEPKAEDKDGDGKTDTVTYVIKNTFDMPKITVSGEKTWVDVPKGNTVPDVTVRLMLGGTEISAVTLSEGTTAYEFTDLDRYNADGSVCNYTVEEDAVDNYSVSYSEAITDENGNITIDITNTGTFTYGTLTISNEITGEDAPEGDSFEFIVTLGSDVEYEYTGSYSGTIKNGDVISLKDGESITISGILTGVSYMVETEKKELYTPNPSDGKIAGTISSSPEIAAFTNNFQLPPNGNLEISNKVTGDKADKEKHFKFIVEFDSDEEFECMAGEKTFLVRSGDTIELKHGETAVIYKLPEGIAYTVTGVSADGYKMTCTGEKGVITTLENKAAFIFAKKSEVLGESDTPDTGDDRGNLIAVYVMQSAMLMMAFCLWHMKHSRKTLEHCGK